MTNLLHRMAELYNNPAIRHTQRKNDPVELTNASLARVHARA